MGREARATAAAKPQAVSVTLERGDYFELRTLNHEVHLRQLDAQRFVAEAVQKREVFMRKLVTQYPALAPLVDTAAEIQLQADDQACALTFQPPGQ